MTDDPSAPGAGSAEEAFRRFGVDEDLVRRAMAAALSRGGDACDLFFQHTVGTAIVLRDREVNQASTRVSLGVGIRVLLGDQVGFSFCEDLDEAAILRAARTAAAIASGGGGQAPAAFRPVPHPDHHALQVPWETVPADRKVALLRDLDARVFASDPRILKASVRYSDETTHVLIATSEGRVAWDTRPLCSLGASAVAEQGGRREDASWAYSARDGFACLRPERLARIAREIGLRIARGFEAVKPAGGEMEVVLAPGGAGILLHEAIGHGLEADFNRKRTSVFADQLGQAVAAPFVSIVDDATLPHARGSLNVDDEANPTQCTPLVEKGRLAGYLHDRISAAFYKVAPTGNGRRQSYRFAPLPRMRSTYMLPGPHDPEEILRSVKKGIYAEDFTNGEVQIGAGDFTFYVKSGFLIEEGRLTRPIKDVNIIGNGPEVLRNITMVGHDLELSEATWTCGKDGQGVPVSQGLPTCKVSSLTVGGVNV